MAIPYNAYFERPFVAPNLIRRSIAHQGEMLDFTIDPGTQNWAILDRRARTFARLADGKTRLVDIIESAGKISPANDALCSNDILALHNDMTAAGRPMRPSASNVSPRHRFMLMVILLGCISKSPMPAI